MGDGDSDDCHGDRDGDCDGDSDGDCDGRDDDEKGEPPGTGLESRDSVKSDTNEAVERGESMFTGKLDRERDKKNPVSC